MAGALVLTGIATLSIPPLLSAVLALLAIAITAATRAALRLERSRLDTARQRWLLMLGVVGAPMALFGFAMGSWTTRIAGQWDGTLGILVIIGTLAALILNRRVTSIITAQVSLWTGTAIVFGASGTYFSLAVGALVGIYTAYR